MALPIVKIKYEGEAIYSPFSGEPADVPDGPNESDSTLLFIYYGNAGQYGLLSRRVIEAAKLKGVEGPEDCELKPAALAKKLSFPGGFVMEVDTGWNGVNWYGFAAVKR